MALTTLANVKTHLRITDASEDTLLDLLITEVSARIERATNRAFNAVDYAEFFKADDTQVVVIRNFPIITVNRVATGIDTAIDVKYDGTDIRAFVSVTDTAVRLISTSAAGVTTTTTLTFTSNQTASLMATAITAVADWTGTNRIDILSNNLHRLGGLNAKDVTVDLSFPDHDIADYIIDYDLGQVRLIHQFHHDPVFHDERVFRGFVLVEYRGGFETIPADIEALAIGLIKEGFDGSKISGALSSESIGDYSYSVGTGELSTVTDDQIRSRLGHYMNISIAGVA